MNIIMYAAAAKSLQSCPTLCDPIDSSPPGYPVPGILQARTLEWVAISFSNAWKWKVKVKSLSRVQLLVTPGTATHQAPLSMRFSRQENWSGVPLPSPVEGLGKLIYSLSRGHGWRKDKMGYKAVFYTSVIFYLNKKMHHHFHCLGYCENILYLFETLTLLK